MELIVLSTYQRLRSTLYRFLVDKYLQIPGWHNFF